MKIAVAGAGYVGLSNAVLLARQNAVTLCDIDADRIALVAASRSPIRDDQISAALAEDHLDLRATTDPGSAYSNADFVIVATPTNYDPETNSFDTKSIEAVVTQVLAVNPCATIVIRSTIPVGYVNRVRCQFNHVEIMFAPEFLREGSALHDCRHPTRIIVGDTTARAQLFAELLRNASDLPGCPMLLMRPDEAESVKLFANAYLAMRVAFFNELDSFALTKGFDASKIITGIGLDSRIGLHYNNPSFGYGGYCLPKDARQLLASFGGVPQSLIGAIVDSNIRRKKFISDFVIAKGAQTVGVYRLAMKEGSDNFRDASVLDVIHQLHQRGIRVLVFEPLLDGKPLEGCETLIDLEQFKSISEIILCNRQHAELSDVADKVFTRDQFGRD